MVRLFSLFLIVFVSAVSYLYFHLQTHIQESVQQDFQSQKQRLQQVILNYQVSSEVTFRNNIMVPEVLNLLHKVNQEKPKQLDQLHSQLYQLLKEKYQHLNAISKVRQLHFHLADGTSFLRMHRPNKYGDPLFDVRYSVKKANQEKIFVQGFEEGRIFNGYRFVYPIIDQGQHLGSVEISFSIGALLDSLIQVYGSPYCFILSTDLIGKKVFEDEKSNYIESPFGEKFALDKGLQNQTCSINNPDISRLLKQVNIEQALAKIQPYSHVLSSLSSLDFSGNLAHFIPLNNIQGTNVAYITTFSRNPKIEGLYKNYIYNVLTTSLGLFVIFSFIIYLKRRQSWLQAQKTLLEQTVHERTQQIELALKKERYIKRVLETIFGISEHLNVADKIDNLLDETCDRLTSHQFYHFAHTRLQNHKLEDIETCGAIVLDIPSKQLTEFYRTLENDPFFLENIQQNQVVIFFTSDQNPAIKILKSYFDRYQIKSAVFIPLFNQSTNSYLGYLTIFTSTAEHLEEERMLFKELGQAISSALISLERKESYEQLLQEKLQNYKDMIYAMVDLMEQRDAYTAGHTQRVANYSKMIAKAINLDADQISNLVEAAMLHDIGKIVTPDSILLKPGRLNDEEFSMIQQHVTTGAEVLEKLDFFKDLKQIMMYHHEKYDGTGYPSGLKGEEIPLLSRIMTIADAFDAMTTQRIYKPRKSVAEALAELEKCKGTHFDPLLVDAALNALKQVTLDETINQLPWKGPEFERMAYHFKDKETGFSNRLHLKILLDNQFSGLNPKLIQQITLEELQAYQNQFGEEKANQFLHQFASNLKAACEQHLSFYLGAGKFLLIHKEWIDLDSQRKCLQATIEDTGVQLAIENLRIQDKPSIIESLKKELNLS